MVMGAAKENVRGLKRFRGSTRNKSVGEDAWRYILLPANIQVTQVHPFNSLLKIKSLRVSTKILT